MLRAILWLAVSTQAQADDDKASLPYQEKEARALCETNGWHITDVLEVPGHSRRYVDIHECARDMQSQGIEAFDKLLRHWDNQDFDVIVVRDGSRFARTQTLHAYVVERTIGMDGRIYSLLDGWIDSSNYRMWIAMGGYSAAGEIDNLVKRREMGFAARVKRGLPANHSVPKSHKIVRDEKTGKALRVELNDDYLPMWDDLASLILEGVAWRKIEQEMFDRYGHANTLGEPLPYNHFHRLVYTPAFWGNTARHFKHKGRGAWVYQEGEPIPEGATIYYDMHPPVWDDEIAERIKAELHRRHTVIKGRARPAQTKPFTGILICGECGYNVTFASKDSWEAWRCMSRYESSPLRPDCEQTKSISLKNAREYIDGRLREMLEVGSLDAFFPNTNSKPDNTAQSIKQSEKKVKELEKTMRRIILDRAKTDDDNLLRLYDDEINTHSERLRKMQRQLAELRHDAVRENTTIQQRAYNEIAELSVDAFWEQEDKFINQVLHRLIGRKRFVVMNGEIIGVADAPVRTKRYEGK